MHVTWNGLEALNFFSFLLPLGCTIFAVILDQQPPRIHVTNPIFIPDPRCHATDDVTLSAVSALRGAAAAVVEEATKVIGAAVGDGEPERYDNSSAPLRRLGAPPTAMVSWIFFKQRDEMRMRDTALKINGWNRTSPNWNPENHLNHPPPFWCSMLISGCTCARV